MSVAMLNLEFEAAAQQGEIGAAISPLMGKLVATLGVTSLLVGGARASRPANSALLSGSTLWSNSRWRLTLIGTVNSSGQDQLALTLVAENGQQRHLLSSLVPDLPASWRPSTNAAGTLSRGASVLAELGVLHAQIEATAVGDDTETAPPPRLSGSLPLLDSPLEPYIGLLGASQLTLTGQIDPRLEAPAEAKVDLSCAAVNAASRWPSPLAEAELGLVLTTAEVDPFPFFSGSGAGTVSSVLLRASLLAEGAPERILVATAPLLRGGQGLDFVGTLTPPLTLVDGLSGIQSLLPSLSSATLALPSGVSALNAFGLSHLRIGFKTGTNGLPQVISHTGFTISSTAPWDLPIPFLRIDQVTASWLANWIGSRREWRGFLFGAMQFGEEGGAGTAAPVLDEEGHSIALEVSVALPELDVKAVTTRPFLLNLPSAMAVFFPGQQPEVDSSLLVEHISMGANLSRQQYGATLRTRGGWSLPIGDVTFALDEVTFEVNVSQAAIWGGLAGTAGVYVGGEQQLLLAVGAYYPGGGSWQFQGGLAQGEIDLPTLIYAFLGQQAPAWLDDSSLALTRLWAEYSTGLGHPYAVEAALAARWDPQLLGIKLSLALAARIARRPRVTTAGRRAGRDLLRLNALASNAPPLYRTLLQEQSSAPTTAMIYEGSLQGSFELNRLTIGVDLSFLSAEMTALYRLQLGEFSLEARSAWSGEGEQRHQLLTVAMQGGTLGELIASLATLANPNTNYRLPEPWRALDEIPLGRFTLLLDPSLQTVSMEYTVQLELGFMTLTRVGVRYDRSRGEPQVKIELAGQFLGKHYDSATGLQPLSWDALNDAPPLVPGGGRGLVDVRYLGLGQHVALSAGDTTRSVAEVIAQMRAQLRPTDSSQRNPLDQPSGSLLRFDERSQWLIGVELVALECATLQLVLADPDLYGVRIALAGSQAGALAGLAFELSYRKLSSGIGLFQGRLQVPTRFRQLDLGAIALTLGTIGVDIYTNGDFKVDLGFPQQRDFSRSFGLRYGKFTGKGGIYFGRLSGATSSQVPALANGQFAPVLELGVGVTAGMRWGLVQGALSAECELLVEVIFEGVLAWFHPDDQSSAKAIYYSAQGNAALLGKVYGKLAFKFITAEVSFEARAAASLALAAHRATTLRLELDVAAHCLVEVGWFEISYSFAARLSLSQVIGHDTTPPWVLAADQSGQQQARRGARGHTALARQAPFGILPQTNASRATALAPRRRPELGVLFTRHLGRARRAGAVALPITRLASEIADPCGQGHYQLSFDPSVQVFPAGSPAILDVRLVPAFTMAEPTVVWPGERAPVGDEATDYQVVITLVIDGPSPVGAESLAEHRSAPFNTTARAMRGAETPFARLTEALFRRAIASLGLDPLSATITAGDLAELTAQLACPQTFANGFSFDQLSAFFNNNLQLHLSTTPSGEEPPTTMGGVAFPMLPLLKWTCAQIPELATRDFAKYQLVDEEYAAAIETYFRQLSPQPRLESTTGTGIASGESLASVVFREYLLLLTRLAVEAAEQLLARCPVALDTAITLTQIAQRFPTLSLPYAVQSGDTVEQVAASCGASSAELLALNPNLEGLLEAAEPGSQLSLVLGVTPESIAAGNPERLLSANLELQVPALATEVRAGESAAQLCQWVGAEVDHWLSQPVALDAPAITRAGAGLALPAGPLVVLPELTLRQIAALLYVRLRAGQGVATHTAGADWYGEAIVQLNDKNIAADGTLPSQIMLPYQYDNVVALAIPWQRLVGDSLPLLAATTALWQNLGIDPGFELWWQQLAQLNPDHVVGEAVQLPATTTALLPGETLRALAARLLWVTDPYATSAEPTGDFRSLVANADLLAPLAPVVVTNCTLATQGQESLRQFAARYDLTLEAVGRLAADQAGLFDPTPGALLVPAVLAIDLDRLIPLLTADLPLRDLAGQLSRFMLHGQRLPTPDGASMQGLYQLIGQQVEAPVFTSFLPLLSFLFQLNQPTPWIELVGSATVPAGAAEQAALQAAWPELAARNPALATGGLRQGMVVETARVDGLLLEITAAQAAAGNPAPYLAPVLPALPSALPLWEAVALLRYALPQRLTWQLANWPALPILGGRTSAVGMPSLWPFPADLQARADATNNGPFQLYASDPQLDEAPRAIERFTWATRVVIRLSRIPGRPHAASVNGSDAQGRQRLLALRHYLAAHPEEGATLLLGFDYSSAAGLGAGLISPSVAAESVYVVRTNLTTDTRADTPATPAWRSTGAGGAASGPYFAPLSDPRGFLKLLWEASVVGGDGYWLGYSDQAGQGLDEAIWRQDGYATISLLVVLDSAAAATPNRQLLPLHNAAFIADPIDATSTLLSVAAAAGQEQVRRASVAQGQIGFTLGVELPAQSGDDPQLRARQLFQLTSYQLAESDCFNASHTGRPVAPQLHGGAALDLQQRNGVGAVAGRSQQISQVIPIHRFAKQNPLPLVPGLPPAEANPYAGIASAGTEAPPVVRVLLGFHDVFGNSTAQTPPVATTASTEGAGP